MHRAHVEVVAEARDLRAPIPAVSRASTQVLQVPGTGPPWPHGDAPRCSRDPAGELTEVPGIISDEAPGPRGRGSRGDGAPFGGVPGPGIARGAL